MSDSVFCILISNLSSLVQRAVEHSAAFERFSLYTETRKSLQQEAVTHSLWCDTGLFLTAKI